MLRLLILSIALLAACASPSTAAACVPFSSGWNDFTPCTRLDPSGQRWVTPEHLRDLAFDKDGVAAVWIESIKAFHYVGRDGRMVAVLTYDNAPDAFVDGRARTRHDGRIGYIDRKLRLAIPARYDWGFPFEHGRAVVCRGCAQASDGEHRSVDGGMWGMIDRYGREVVPLRYRSMEELPK